MKKIISILLMLFIALSFCSCKSKKKEVIGQWYNSNKKCLDIRSDGTWKLESSYGTGEWKFLDDDITIEFIDFYGDTQESAINEDELGKYIDFGYYGKFYKNAYPTDEEIEKVKNSNATQIDPFDRVEYEASGISPYCKITVNNQNCDNEVQKYVTYKLDKDFYANGEKVKITAILPENTGDKNYKLNRTETTYMISGQSEYASSQKQIDVNYLQSEVNDKITSLISSSIGTNIICDVSDMHILDYESRLSNANFYLRKGITDVTSNLETAYFSCLKQQKRNAQNNGQPYNRYSFIYCFNVSGNVNDVICKGNLYVNISAENIICSSDGTVSWDNSNCSLKVSATADGLDKSISSTIMNFSDNYNISKVE